MTYMLNGKQFIVVPTGDARQLTIPASGANNIGMTAITRLQRDHSLA